jgi:glycosyltransferase involved in cell wall biosynthesis
VTISVVVPTRNRTESLGRVLRALAAQTRPATEVIVVDASDEPARGDGLSASHPGIQVAVIESRPNVCAQRNAGIRAARGEWVLLCDDDIEPPADYLQRLGDHVATVPTCGIVTGVLEERDAAGRFSHGFSPPSLRHLLFAFVFQTSVFSDVEGLRFGALTRPVGRLLTGWYRRRGNAWTLAGWPLLTQTRGEVIEATSYGLGAALVRRDWLLEAPFDERLGPHGIGDNYGVALRLHHRGRIAILSDLPVRHHQESVNRLGELDATYARALALDHFLRETDRFGRIHRLALAWSLVGQTSLLALRGRTDAARRTAAALVVVATGRNPLRRAAAP